jgi:hypothetical protein
MHQGDQSCPAKALGGKGEPVKGIEKANLRQSNTPGQRGFSSGPDMSNPRADTENKVGILDTLSFTVGQSGFTTDSLLEMVGVPRKVGDVGDIINGGGNAGLFYVRVIDPFTIERDFDRPFAGEMVGHGRRIVRRHEWRWYGQWHFVRGHYD